ncbi:proteasome subunit beta type-1 [Phlebotomus papatasi]|uniref:Proteasome subunit beta n=1 Tax=Phlebotomus papatasi TaxID=29031 RepID=A0A1B0DC63_PHLPP|nr:proteasome subunit beta type-1 [Phlebotomus papatasi]
MSLEEFPEYEVPGAIKRDFYPYESNGGSVVAIAGDDFAVIGADTRLSSGYSIHSRNQAKLFKLTDSCVLSAGGCWCDIQALTSLINAKMQMYKHQHQRTMSTNAIAQMISITMYNKRFFPYYTSTIVAGLDVNGKGRVFSYDPIGNCEESDYKAGGSSGALLMPVLDNQVGFKNMENVQNKNITVEKAVALTRDTFISAAERDIYTGDGIIVNIITQDGIEEKRFDLRRD